MKTVTIGIPAYNEENNINQLIKNLLTQIQIGFDIKQIFLVSDGSTDNTVSEAKKINSNILKIINNKERKGMAIRLNQIIGLTNTDILIILNADIIPKNKYFIYQLIKPIILNKADLTSAKMLSLPINNMFEKVVEYGNKYTTSIFESYKSGNNIYLCHGAARAFSKKLYKLINFKKSYGEDAYSYLICKSLGFKFFYSKKAVLFYKLPENYKDYARQGIRFIKSKKLLTKEFGKEIIDKNYKLSVIVYINQWIRFFFKSPIKLIVYSLLIGITRIFGNLESSQPQEIWEISDSTKNLIKPYEY